MREPTIPTASTNRAMIRSGEYRSARGGMYGGAAGVIQATIPANIHPAAAIWKNIARIANMGRLLICSAAPCKGRA